MATIKDKYLNRIIICDNVISKLKKRSTIYVAGKILFFLAFIYSIYAAYPQYTILGISSILILLVAYGYTYWLDMRCISKIDFLNRKKKVCENEIRYLEGDFSCFSDGKDYIDMSHEYSYDLDLFGPDSLFNRINRSITKKGEKLLVNRLTHILSDKEEIDINREAVQELKNMVDWKIDFLSQGFIDDNLDSLSVSLGKDKKIRWPFVTYISYLSILITFVSLILGVIGILPIRYFMLMFLLQLITAALFSGKASHTNLHAEKLKKEFRGYQYILEMIKNQHFQSLRLKQLHYELFNSSNNSSKAFRELTKILNMFDQRNSEFMYVLLNGLFLYDLYLIRIFNGWTSKYLSHVATWINSIAQVDELVSLATYAYNNPDNVQAEVIALSSKDCENIIECKGVYHPFLWRKHPVVNDFVLKRDNVAIVTGANMAGKSTFLRTIGVNYILACCGAPVAAASFRFAVVSLFSSMRTTDNLSKDISYFNAELLRLQQLIEHVRSHDYTLIILDEILKGTNSKDKLEGSVMFLHEITKFNIAGIIATHDLELSKLEETDADVFLNYCFEIELSENIKYSYKIGRGVSKNMNATFLLKNILNE